jgi:hypothetical protein
MDPTLLSGHKQHAFLVLQHPESNRTLLHHEDPDTENVEAESLTAALALKGACNGGTWCSLQSSTQEQIGSISTSTSLTWHSPF